MKYSKFSLKYTGVLLYLLIMTQSMAQDYLIWNRVEQDILGQPEDSVLYYQVYRDSFPGFTPSPANFIAATTDTTFSLVDSGIDANWYYKVTCSDRCGNQSGYEKAVSLNPFVILSVKILLHAAWIAPDSMRTSLQTDGLIPECSPYPEAIRCVDHIPANIVDWIRLGISDSLYSNPKATQSFLLRKDGYLVEPDGFTKQLGIPNVTAGNYYLHIFHRTHQHVISSSPVACSENKSEVYDFTSTFSMYHQNGHYVNIDGTETWALRGGDANFDGKIDSTDFKSWYEQALEGIKGYKASDINCDGYITTQDYLFWYNSFNR